MELEELKNIGNSIGFFKVEELNIDKIKLLPEVRQMCSTDKCHMYGRNWSCPPACGTLEECAADISGYKKGIIVQTKGELEDEFDGEGMMETEALHKEHFVKMHDQLKKFFPKLLSLGAGCCTRCAKCSYPDAPCRFPEKRFSSMEAYGMLVTQVCQDSGIEYYYGPEQSLIPAAFSWNKSLYEEKVPTGQQFCHMQKKFSVLFLRKAYIGFW